MCDKDLLVGYLYDELPPAERSKFEAHLFACAECREEIAALRATRAHLAEWAPPEPNLGFQIIRAGTAPAVARRFRVSPAWGMAAAAVLLLAVASAIANLDVTIGRDGLSVRTGWSPNANPAPLVATVQPEPSAAPGAAGSDAALRAELLRMQTELRDLKAAVSARTTAARPQTASTASPSAMSNADLLRQVRTIVSESISESEARQDREMALRYAQFVKDMDLQRRADMTQVELALGRLEAYTGARIVRASHGR
jgi:hypothetical protein